MNITKDKNTEIFCLSDEFYINYKKTIEKQLVGNKPKKSPKMSESEVVTIMTLFHYGAFKNFKHFYTNYVQIHLTNEFPSTVSYNRFVELMQNAVVPITIILKTCGLENCTGITFCDSTPIRVCKSKRIKRKDQLNTKPRNRMN